MTARRLDRPPEGDGWHRIKGATTAPNGWEWWGRGSRFPHVTGLRRYEHVLVRVPARVP